MNSLLRTLLSPENGFGFGVVVVTLAVLASVVLMVTSFHKSKDPFDLAPPGYEVVCDNNTKLLCDSVNMYTVKDRQIIRCETQKGTIRWEGNDCSLKQIDAPETR